VATARNDCGGNRRRRPRGTRSRAGGSLRSPRNPEPPSAAEQGERRGYPVRVIPSVRTRPDRWRRCYGHARTSALPESARRDIASIRQRRACEYAQQHASLASCCGASFATNRSARVGRARRMLPRESKRHELDMARCVRFCSVASAATRSALPLRVAAGSEQKCAHRPDGPAMRLNLRDCRSERQSARAAGSPQRQHRFRRPRALPHSAGARLQVSTNTANGRRLGECRSAWLSDSLAAGRDPSAPSRQERHRAALLPHSQAEGAVRRDCRPGQPILVGLLVWSTTWTPSMLCGRLCGVDARWDAFFLLSAF